jgi:hypothetical protein
LLLIVRGLTGTGKSTLATAISDSFGFELLQTDALRQELFGASQQPAAFDRDGYRIENRMKVYDEMFDRAGKLLADRVSVVLDGTFLTTKLRAHAMLLARRYEATPVLIHCACPDTVARERIATRLAASRSPSESRPEFVPRQRERNEVDPPGADACQVDTVASLPLMLEQVNVHLRRTLR